MTDLHHLMMPSPCCVAAQASMSASSFLSAHGLLSCRFNPHPPHTCGMGIQLAPSWRPPADPPAPALPALCRQTKSRMQPADANFSLLGGFHGGTYILTLINHSTNGFPSRATMQHADLEPLSALSNPGQQHCSAQCQLRCCPEPIHVALIPPVRKAWRQCDCRCGVGADACPAPGTVAPPMTALSRNAGFCDLARLLILLCLMCRTKGIQRRHRVIIWERLFTTAPCPHH